MVIHLCVPYRDDRCGSFLFTRGCQQRRYALSSQAARRQRRRRIAAGSSVHHNSTILRKWTLGSKLMAISAGFMLVTGIVLTLLTTTSSLQLDTYRPIIFTVLGILFIVLGPLVVCRLLLNAYSFDSNRVSRPLGRRGRDAGRCRATGGGWFGTGRTDWACFGTCSGHGHDQQRYWFPDEKLPSYNSALVLNDTSHWATKFFSESPPPYPNDPPPSPPSSIMSNTSIVGVLPPPSPSNQCSIFIPHPLYRASNHRGVTYADVIHEEDSSSPTDDVAPTRPRSLSASEVVGSKKPTRAKDRRRLRPQVVVILPPDVADGVNTSASNASHLLCEQKAASVAPIYTSNRICDRNGDAQGSRDVSTSHANDHDCVDDAAPLLSDQRRVSESLQPSTSTLRRDATAERESGTMRLDLTSGSSDNGESDPNAQCKEVRDVAASVGYSAVNDAICLTIDPDDADGHVSDQNTQSPDRNTDYRSTALIHRFNGPDISEHSL